MQAENSDVLPLSSVAVAVMTESGGTYVKSDVPVANVASPAALAGSVVIVPSQVVPSPLPPTASQVGLA